MKNLIIALILLFVLALLLLGCATTKLPDQETCDHVFVKKEAAITMIEDYGVPSELYLGEEIFFCLCIKCHQENICVNEKFQ